MVPTIARLECSESFTSNTFNRDTKPIDSHKCSCFQCISVVKSHPARANFEVVVPIPDPIKFVKEVATLHAVSVVADTGRDYP